MVRILFSVSGICWLVRPTATRFSIWAFSIRFWNVRVIQKRSGVIVNSRRPRPVLFIKMMTRMLTSLQRSAAMLMMPEENRLSTVFTSLTNRDAVTPGSRSTK